MRCHVGTCGFSYPEWVDAGIYPPKTKSAEMLSLYSRNLHVVELNYSWYQMVRADAVERMRDRVPADFRFCAKLTRTMTHEIGDDWAKQAGTFCHGIQPLLDSGQLLSVLVQLPPNFHWTRSNRLYLARLFDALASLPLAVEFRHRSWARDSVFHTLQERRITLVRVDAPALPALFPALTELTNPDLFYLRLHGRNGAAWHAPSMQDKFNYCYSNQELEQVVATVLALQGQVLQSVILFNNHVAGQAFQNALTMVDLLSRAA
jgi:uncharacterized protein YecE (DUF72 family)